MQIIIRITIGDSRLLGLHRCAKASVISIVVTHKVMRYLEVVYCCNLDTCNVSACQSVSVSLFVAVVCFSVKHDLKTMRLIRI
jgi:hypothetical protein